MEADSFGNRRLSEYRMVRLLGKGAFAEVYEYERKDDGRVVAIKQVLREEKAKGANLGAIKELQVLQELQHDHIITLHEVFPLKGKINLVLERAATDLDRIIRDRTLLLSLADIKSLMHMFLTGLHFVHSKGFMHRDLKPENIFVTSEGILKLGDFGHATRIPTSQKSLYPQVITDWYRPPELLFGSFYHTEKVDIWSAGCIFAELVLRLPLFRGSGGDDEARRLSQLSWIVRLLGTPDKSDWEDMDLLPAFVDFGYVKGADLGQLFGRDLGPEGVELLSSMLAFDPKRRVSAGDALAAPFFSAMPAPTPPASLPLGLESGSK